MGINACSLCLFAWLSTARSARLTSEKAERIPGRRSVALGVAMGIAFSGDAVAALPEANLERSVDLAAGPSGDVFDRAESALITFLRDYRLEDETVVKKLMDDLRRSKSVDRGVIEMLDASLRGTLSVLPEVLGVSGKGTDKEVAQQIIVPRGKSNHDILIGRYLAYFHDVENEGAFQNLLLNMKLSRTHDEDLFLRCIAQSHTAEELEKGIDAEFMVMFEPFSGTLRQFVTEHSVSNVTRMFLFVDVMRVASRVYELGIPHKSNIGIDTVLVKGDASAPDSLKVVLSPAILISQSKKSPLDKYDSDVRQLGSLLKWMFNESTWPEDARPSVGAILAFGRAMESGAFLDNHDVLNELLRMTETVFSASSTYSDLASMRMEYLRLALAVVKPSDRPSAPAGSESSNAQF